MSDTLTKSRAAPGTGDGGEIPGTGHPAFTATLPETQSIPVVIAAPHGGRVYPEDALETMREPEWSRIRLEDRYVDRIAESVAEATGAAVLIAHAPRAILDLNRSPEDVDWGMVEQARPRQIAHSRDNRRARGGLGLIPRRLPGLGEIWSRRLSPDAVETRLEHIHRPYHSALGQMLDDVRDKWGVALLVDLHSMPPLKPRTAQDCPAEFVVGDRFGSSCHDALVGAAMRYFAGQRRRVSHNRPYSGGYVLDRHSAPRRQIHAMQLEVCRSIYLDARLEEPSPRLPAVVRLLSGLVRELAFEATALAGQSEGRLAAE